eukprot:2386574-Pyramimonas_sp.AAC.1
MTSDILEWHRKELQRQDKRSNLGPRHRPSASRPRQRSSPNRDPTGGAAGALIERNDCGATTPTPRTTA